MVVRTYSRDSVAELKRSIDLRSLIPLEKSRDCGNYIAGRCPLPDHLDERPSFLVYQDGFVCLGCGCSGDLFDWLAYSHGLSIKSDFRKILELAQNGEAPRRIIKKSKPPEKKPTLDPVIAQRFHANLGSRRSYFRRRGFTDKIIDRELLGWTGYRYVIPVWKNLPGVSELLQLRMRIDPIIESKKKKAGEDYHKIVGLKGYNSATIYKQELLNEGEAIVIFFGEFDALLAHQEGIRACSPTNGASAFKRSWVDSYFSRFKEIVVCPDIGEEEQGERVVKMFGSRARMVSFPEMGEGEKDFTDFILSGRTSLDFLELLIRNNSKLERYWESH